MAIDSAAPRTRRALLGAALGAGAATVASALGRPLPVRAAGSDGSAVLIGGQYDDAQSTTYITNKTNANTVLSLYANDPNYQSGGIAIQAQAYDGAIWATGIARFGVYGRTVSGECGVLAQADAGSGLHGNSGPTLPHPPPDTGVFGYSARGANSRGVVGQSTAGHGVHGVSTSERGVVGESTSGTGGYFTTPDPMVGTSLRATGRVRLDKSAGIARIAEGTNSIVVAPGIDLSGSSAVVATLQGNAGGTTTVHRCVVNATTNTFTIYLTAKSTTTVKVAWHVFG